MSLKIVQFFLAFAEEVSSFVTDESVHERMAERGCEKSEWTGSAGR
jgi:hypothetical protein